LQFAGEFVDSHDVASPKYLLNTLSLMRVLVCFALKCRGKWGDFKLLRGNSSEI